MKINRLWIGLFAAVALALAVYVALFMVSPTALVKESPTSLAIDSSLVFIRDGSRGVEVSVLVHSYDPPGIREFVSRVYHFTPNYHMELDGSDVTSIRTKTGYFINRSAGDGSSPVAAEFTVNWAVKGKNNAGTIILDNVIFSGKTLDASPSTIPEELKPFIAPASEPDSISLNLSELDSRLAVDDEGSYTIEMKGIVNYTFISWSGHRVSNIKNYTVFWANVSYSKGEHNRIRVYYPMNFFTETVRITHPLLVKAKSTLGVIR
jgi:hypothetical protein